MQKEDISAAEGQAITVMTVSTLKSLRNDANFDLFWQKITASAEDLHVDKPALPRRRKVPRRLDNGSAPTLHKTVEDIFAFFRNCTPGQLELMSQISKLVKLLLVMPATNAGSERSFSAVRRIKTYLRSTMSQQRLNHLMLLHVHKSETDALNLVDVANDFIAGNDHRKHVFGTEFKQSDLV